MELLHQIINWIVEIVHQLGYTGIFIWMFLESSFFPFPSEVIMIPAWYLAYQGKMNLILAILAGIAGSVAGAWFNYILASKLGRKFLLKFMSEEKLAKLDNFFKNHGHISTFTWRLIPGVRQYISFPAGLGKMHPWKFTFYTALWAGIWVIILALLGYFIGANQELVQKYLKQITIGTLVFVGVLIGFYYFYQKKRK